MISNKTRDAIAKIPRSRPDVQRKSVQYVVTFVVFAVAAVVATYPLVRNLSASALETGDTLQVAWLLAWNADHLIGTPTTLFSAGVMYPEPYPLVYIEHMRGLLPVFAPFYYLSRNALLSFNISVLLAYALTGFAFFVFVRELFPQTKASWSIALLAGFLFAFSPWRMLRFHHLEQLSAYWIPVGLLFLVRYLKMRHWTTLLGFVACITLQTLVSYYYIPICGVLVIATVAFMLTDRQTSSGAIVIACCSLAGVMIAAHFPLALMYLRSHSSALISVSEQHVFSIQSIRDFVSGKQSAWVRMLIFGSRAEVVSTVERVVDAGAVAYVLFVACLASLVRSSFRYRAAALVAVGVVLVSLALSLGPYVQIADRAFPAPFAFLLRFPGVGSLRAPARLWQAALFASALMGALAMWRLTHKLPGLVGTIASLTLALLVIVPTYNPQRSISRVDLADPVFAWIRASLPQNAILLQVPLDIRNDGFPDVGESAKMYQSIYHRHTMFNSFLAYAPIEQKAKHFALTSYPSAEANKCLRELGVTHVLVDKQRLSSDAEQRLDALVANNPSEAQRCYETPRYEVFAVADEVRSSSDAVSLHFEDGWHDLELNGPAWWYWSRGPSVIELKAEPNRTVSLTAKIGIPTAPATLRVFSGQTLVWEKEFLQPGFYPSEPITITTGANGDRRIRFDSDQPPTRVGVDPRLLSIGIGDVSLNNVPVGVCQLR